MSQLRVIKEKSEKKSIGRTNQIIGRDIGKYLINTVSYAGRLFLTGTKERKTLVILPMFLSRNEVTTSSSQTKSDNKKAH